MSKTPEFRAWEGMLSRCYYEKNASYSHYGARGIKVCDRWRDSFENFYADLGPRPAGCSLDRVNVDEDYEAANCRWADITTQNRNRRCVKLDEIDAMQIRWLAIDGGYTHARIAKAFRVSRPNVSMIVNGHAWRQAA